MVFRLLQTLKRVVLFGALTFCLVGSVPSPFTGGQGKPDTLKEIWSSGDLTVPLSNLGRQIPAGIKEGTECLGLPSFLQLFPLIFFAASLNFALPSRLSQTSSPRWSSSLPQPTLACQPQGPVSKAFSAPEGLRAPPRAGQGSPGENLRLASSKLWSPPTPQRRHCGRLGPMGECAYA